MRRTAHLRALIIIACLVLGACGGGSRGPDIRIFDGSTVSPGGQGQAATTGGSSQSPVASDGMHSVRRGETLYAISRAYGVPLRALITENGLSPPYELEIGQRLRIPASRVHTVVSGDTVYGISRQYGVSMSELVRANQIAPPYTIRLGQQLAIPGSMARSTNTVSAPAQPSSGASDVPPPNNPPQTAAVPDQPLPPQPDPPSPPVPVEPDYGPDGVVYPIEKPRPPVRLVGPIPQPPALSGDGFLWPVRGSVLSTFGPKDGGQHNDGINIAAPRGTPILAAETGVVAYAGDNLPGFGNMILIRHDDGFITAYAHAEALLVERGQVVRRGQAIARVGSTGTVDVPQVHFQIREGREAIDPRRHLLTS